MIKDISELLSINLDHFFKQVGVAVTLLNTNYEILWHNEMFRNWFGKPSGKYCYYLHRTDGPCLNCSTQLTMISNTASYSNLVGIGSTGRKNTYRFTTIPLRDMEEPSADLFLEIIENINLKSQNNHHNLAIFSLDQTGRIISTNPEHLKLAEAPSEKVLGLNWLDIPKSHELGLSKYLQEGLQGEPFELFNFRYLTYRGDKEIYMNLKGLPLQRLNPRLNGLLCLAMDTTDQQKKSAMDSSIIGQDPSIKGIIRHIDLVAKYSCPVLIVGESGTGKEMIAQEIYLKSPRSNQPFIIINAGAIQDSLLESELFGHAKGSFSGAQSNKQGLFEIANNGTFFIDEVGEMSPAMQVKLLRVLENGTFRPVGSLKEVKVNVRIIAATNRNLEDEVSKGNFREDLYYRLNVVKITLPPLRDRSRDIPLLALHFLEQENRLYKMKKQFSLDSMEALMNYHWPGNIRQLANTVKSSFILAEQNLITLTDLPPFLRTQPSNDSNDIEQITPLNKYLAEVEQKYISRVLKSVNNDKAVAAKLLDISLRSLYRKLNGEMNLGSDYIG